MDCTQMPLKFVYYFTYLICSHTSLEIGFDNFSSKPLKLYTVAKLFEHSTQLLFDMSYGMPKLESALSEYIAEHEHALNTIVM